MLTLYRVPTGSEWCSVYNKSIDMSDRHQFRVSWHDYECGVYFVTICSYKKKHIFGYIIDNKMHLSELGKIAEMCIAEIPLHHSDIDLCNSIVMPNHIHMILGVGTRYIASADTNQKDEENYNMGCLKHSLHGKPCDDFHHNSKLATAIGSFKGAVSRIANRHRYGRDISRPYYSSDFELPAPPYWQKRFHEHIITNGRDYDRIMGYVSSNVGFWDNDCFNG